MSLYKKYDMVLISLDPTMGSEQKGTRPCLVIQNNLANRSKLNTTTIVPITSSIKNVPSGILISPSPENGLSTESRIELSQIRTIDKSRIIKKLGMLEEKFHLEVQEKLILFFDVYDEFK